MQSILHTSYLVVEIKAERTAVEIEATLQKIKHMQQGSCITFKEENYGSTAQSYSNEC